MKKIILFALTAFVGLVSFAQQKQTKPPPPPPKVNIDKFVPPPPPPKEPAKNRDYEEFLIRNPTVKRLAWAHENMVRIYLKSGKPEVYDLKKENDVQTVKNKYGELPKAPPPPPKPVVKKFAPPVIKAD